ncbi:hypothetical protein [Pseudoalteromonas sp. R3]|uniref:hypothetical protein n=1 Tax=Pseudoalteromonas sp. R3 TaxID=1709477 RepID=UPI0006B477B2|nr:hypothetical protein [Pseudoalteromonas sp. R3]AZZ99127.1 hypothetical protein ELR70_19690 [Pseudoalteromonas sp. R3]
MNLSKFTTVIVIIIASSFFALSRDSYAECSELIFSGMSDIEITLISVELKNKHITYDVNSIEWDPISGHSVKFYSEYESGKLNLELRTRNGLRFTLQNIEYKNGEASYITEHQGKLKYVKAHW